MLALAAASFIWHSLFCSFHTPLGGIGRGLKGVKKGFISVSTDTLREGLSHLKYSMTSAQATGRPESETKKKNF